MRPPGDEGAVHVAISTGPRVCGAGTADGRDRYRKQRLHPNHALAASNETTLVRRSHRGQIIHRRCAPKQPGPSTLAIFTEHACSPTMTRTALSTVNSEGRNRARICG